MGKQWKQCQTLFFWAPKSLQMVIAAMKLKDAYSLEGKVMTNLDSIFKSRDITLPIKVRVVKAMVLPVVMYGCESWTAKKAEHQRIDAFELWYWRRLLRVPWTARRSNQSILRRSVQSVHWKDWCWSWNSNTLVTSCEELTYWKRAWCWEGLGAGGEGDDRGWDGWMASLLSGYEFEQTLGDSEGQGSLVSCSAWGPKESHMTEWLNNNNGMNGADKMK